MSCTLHAWFHNQFVCYGAQSPDATVFHNWLFIIIMISYPLLTRVQNYFQWIIWQFSSMTRRPGSAPWEEKASETFQIDPVMFSRWSIISALRLTLCVCLNPLHPEWVILEAFSDRKHIRHGWCVAPGSAGLHRGVGRDYVTDYRSCLCVVCEYLTEVKHLTVRRVEVLKYQGWAMFDTL